MDKELENFITSIPAGRDNAIPIPELQRRTGYANRKLRALVAEINKSGEMAIVNMQDGRGYFVPETDEELEEYINIEISRSREIEAKIRGLKRLRTSRENHAAWQRLVRSLNACKDTIEEGAL
jgi:hypothetical protein